MKTILGNKKTTAFALLLLLTSVLLTLYVPVNAQILGEGEPGGVPGPLAPGVVPDVTIKVWAFMSFRPQPVGLGQPILVNLETQPAPGVNRMHQDYTVTITDPDGNEDVIVIDSYPDDGTMWFEYVPDQLGTWTLKFDMIGTYFPAGRYNDGIGPPAENVTGGTLYTESVYFEPASSPTQTLVVQEELVGSWPPSGLPTDYWTRPVPFDRREWWPVIGNYPWHGPAGGPYTVGLAEFEARYPDTNRYRPGHSERGVFTPWVLGPESAHVVWKRQITASGLLGGDYGIEVTMANIFGGMGLGGDPSGYGYPEIIWAGRAYHTFVEPGSGPTPKLVWECYDIRTGETIWKMDAPYIMALIRGVLVPASTTPFAIEYNIGAIPSGGGFPTHVTETTLVYIGRGMLIKYRPVTGAVRANVSIAPLTSGKYYMNGHALSVQNLGGGNYRLINWTTLGTTSNFASRVISNITWPWSSLPNTVDYNVGIAASVRNIQEAGAYSKIEIRAASLKTGQELWNKTIVAAQFSGHTNMADHGKIAVLTLNQGFFAFDLQTGNLAWQSEPMDYPWDASAFGGYSVQSAYGLLYRQAYSGIYAFDWDDGSIAWKYEAPADYPYETPYVNEEGETMYSWNIGAIIADGKMYAYNTEHSATLPITRGWGLHCINATTGEGIWNVDLPGAASKHNPDVKAIADGYLPMQSSDGYMYVFGKGKTKTTVEAPLTAISLGQSVVIKGTVLDMSPAQPGTAAVSKESMGPWMEHLHLQRPIPMDVVGVPVSLDTIDPNGNFIHIADVTSDFTGTFSYLWTPEIPGKFTVMASFMGDDSYGSSYAETAVGVTEAPEPYPEPPEYGSDEWPAYPEAPAYTSVDLAIIAAIVVVAVLVVYDIFGRKRQ